MSAIRLTEEQLIVENARKWRKDRNHFERVDAVGDSVCKASVQQLIPQSAAQTPAVESTQRPGPPLEKDIQREIRDALKFHPAVASIFRVNSGAHVVQPTDGPRRFIRYHDIPGMTDIWCWLKPPHAPRQAFIEVKRVGEHPSDKQAAFLEAVKALGHVAFVASNAADAFERLSAELAA